MSSSTFTTDPLFILLIGIITVVGGIIVLRLHAFLALLLAAFIVAILTPATAIETYALSKGISADLANWHVGKRIATEFGNTCGKIGILIAMASIIGKCMLESGAAEKIVRSTLKITGEKQAPVTFLGSSFFLGIPVFFDTVFYLMIPLAKAMAMRLGKNYLLLVLAITAGAAMANSLVPPTPGPLFLISEMNIPIGMMMMGGFIVGLFTIAAGYTFALWANKKWPVPLRDSIDAPLKNIESLAAKTDENLPPLWFSLMPILIPLILITTKAAFDTFLSPDSNSIIFGFIQFFGEKNTALISGALSALIMLAIQKSGDKSALVESVQTALMSGGIIILITSAGGAFGGMLQQTGISARIGELTSGYQMALIPLAFLIAAVVRTAQGSATVAMITASGILAGMSGTMGLSYHQLYLGLAIACGSKLIPWMNDSGFWIVCKMSNLTEQEALKTFSPMLTIMGIAGLIIILIAAQIFPLI